MNFIQRRSDENFKMMATGKRGIWGFQLRETNKKKHVAIVDKRFLEVRIHYVKGTPPTLCNMMYFDKDDPNAVCELCDRENPKYPGKKTIPSRVRLYLGYVFELFGQKGKSKAGNEYEENPLKVISVPSGKKGINFKPFDNALNDDVLLEEVFVFENDAEAGFVVPEKATLKKLGQQFDLTLPDPLRAEYAQKADADIFSILIAILANVKWDHPDFVEAGLKDPNPPEEATPAAADEGERNEHGQLPVSSADLDE